MECGVVGEHYETPYFHPIRIDPPKNRVGPAKVVVLLLLVKKLEQLKRLNKKFMKLRLRIAQY